MRGPGHAPIPAQISPSRAGPSTTSPHSTNGQAAMIAAMAQLLAATHPDTDAEALRVLREAYPDLPLAMRLAALSLANRKSKRRLPDVHIPK